MRFDDRLATALGQPADAPAARQAVWRQLVDLLAQSTADKSDMRERAFARLREWRFDVSPVARQNAAMLLIGQPVPPDLVEFFLEDATAVYAPLLAAVDMPGREWRELIPRLSPVARALLRHRRDLPKGALRALEAFGTSDLIISGPRTLEVPAPAPVEPEQQGYAAPDIRELRARIDAFREAQTHPVPPEPAEFSFETGPDGVIGWCDAAARGAFVGLSIADAAAGQAHGVDGQAAGAFRHRAPFRDARLILARAERAGGSWLVSGVPSFDPASGRFTGYRGTARRPRVGERADRTGLLGSGLTSDSLKQLAHEVRTPLNAIAGFAEMIERQMLGPAPTAYRHRATAILRETRQLETVLDDLNEAAQLEEASLKLNPGEVDCALLLARIVTALNPMAAARGVQIALSIAPNAPAIRLDPASAERLMTRLLGAAVGLARPGERIAADLRSSDGARPQTCIAIDRPGLLQGYDEQALLDACEVAGEEESAPVLGLGFTLRLVRGLAEAGGGRLAIEAERFVLELPAAVAHEEPEPAIAAKLGERE